MNARRRDRVANRMARAARVKSTRVLLVSSTLLTHASNSNRELAKYSRIFAIFSFGRRARLIEGQMVRRFSSPENSHPNK